MKITFYQFIFEQNQRQDPIGGLSRNIIKDIYAPTWSNSFNRWHKHLIKNNANKENLSALFEVWGDYQAMLALNIIKTNI
jgi:uncharacterized protein YozE (UPF0346 family)